MPARPTAAAGGLGWANLGMDIVSVNRVRRLMADHGEAFFGRMLDSGELADCRTSTGLDVLSLCGRIAAKEAAFKTLRVRNRFLPWLDIVVRRSEGGWPLVELRRSAAAMAAASGITEITVSISHDVDYAVAVAAPILGDSPAAGPAGARDTPAHPREHDTVRSTTMSDGLQQVRDWILKRHPEREDIAPDLDLIENRLIDSLSFVEFVFLLEQLSGRTIEMETLEVDAIRTLGAIDSNFFRAEVK